MQEKIKRKKNPLGRIKFKRLDPWSVWHIIIIIILTERAHPSATMSYGQIWPWSNWKAEYNMAMHPGHFGQVNPSQTFRILGSSRDFSTNPQVRDQYHLPGSNITGDNVIDNQRNGRSEWQSKWPLKPERRPHPPRICKQHPARATQRLIQKQGR